MQIHARTQDTIETEGTTCRSRINHPLMTITDKRRGLTVTDLDSSRKAALLLLLVLKLFPSRVDSLSKVLHCSVGGKRHGWRRV